MSMALNPFFWTTCLLAVLLLLLVVVIVLVLRWSAEERRQLCDRLQAGTLQDYVGQKVQQEAAMRAAQWAQKPGHKTREERLEENKRAAQTKDVVFDDMPATYVDAQEALAMLMDDRRVSTG